MITLESIEKINNNITNAKLKTIQALHTVLFGDDGRPRVARKTVRRFGGFRLDKASEEYSEKLNTVKEKLPLNDVIAVCQILNLDYTGSRDDVASRACSFLNDLSLEDEDELIEEESEEDGKEEEESEEEDITLFKVKDRMHGQSRSDSFALTFRDVEDTIKPFNGKDNYPIRKWISDFEEIATITKWNELQKLIFAKKSLKGLARLFIQSENGIKSWAILKEKLLEEFDVKVSSAQIHKLLMSRKKGFSETVQEYALVMREIGSRVSLETEVIIQYIIDGISDESANKIILYGAKNFIEFKEKIKLYEQIKVKKPVSAEKYQSRDTNKFERKYSNRESQGEPKTRDKGAKGKVLNCFNCGNRGHMSRECPEKSKGTKCFKCNSFGHLAAHCGNKDVNPNKTSSAANIAVIDVVPKNSLMFKVDEININALFDTGSDISILREDVFKAHITDVTLSQDTITVKGLGTSRIKTLGSFSKNIEIDGDSFNILFHVIPKDMISFQVILGNDLLEQADVHIREDGIVVCRKEKDNFLMRVTVDREEINENELDVAHIKDPVHQKKITNLIESYQPQKVQQTGIRMKIILKSEEPIYQRPRRLSVMEKMEVDKQVNEWLENGIVRESTSDFASPIVLVRKKDGSTRICCDYRKINKNVIKDRFPLPLIEDVLDKLEKAKIFTTIDLKNGFFHVDMEEESIKYTSFITPTGQYEFLKCPFGLCNSPAVFQRFISHIFRPLTAKNIVIYYMDDLIIPSSTYEEGIQRLEMVLEIARDYGLEIRKKKCQFLKTKVTFLGYIIEDGKVQPSEEKTLAIKRFSEPTTRKQLQSYLGLTGYFRKFIPSYSIRAKPLSDLLKKDTTFEFGDRERQAFQALKDSLTSYPVLHIFQRELPTELHTDASKYGYGACLIQKSHIDSKLHPVYYFSKKTTPAEEKYTSYELEVLAVITAVKKFRIYLLGLKFKLITDCAAFQKTMDKQDLTTRVARWALLLEEYDYEIEHRAGSRIPHVDALSRYPQVLIITEENGIRLRMKTAQENDENIMTIKKLLELGQDYEGYFIKHELVYKYQDGAELLVVPKGMRNEIIKKAHEEGHFAVKKTEEVIKREFFIPKLKEKIQTVIANCVPCILGNRKEGKQEGFLHSISKQEGPLNTYHADHLGPIPSTNKNYQYILAIIDDFTKFTWLYPTKSTTAKETVNCFVRQQKIFGNPSRIVTDKGTAFTSNDFQDYCVEENINHVLITTGVARGNGQIERVHRIVISVLTKMSVNDPTKWYKYLDRVQRALNSTYQRSINTTPFEVLTGVKMKRKEDLAVNDLIEEEVRKQFCESREELRKECKENLLKIQEENKKGYNLRRKKATLYQEGDLVAIKRTQFGSGLKVNRKFLGPYEVVKVKQHDRYDVRKVGNHEGPISTSTCSEYMKPWVQHEDESESDS